MPSRETAAPQHRPLVRASRFAPPKVREHDDYKDHVVAFQGEGFWHATTNSTAKCHHFARKLEQENECNSPCGAVRAWLCEACKNHGRQANMSLDRRSQGEDSIEEETVSQVSCFKNPGIWVAYFGAKKKA